MITVFDVRTEIIVTIVDGKSGKALLQSDYNMVSKVDTSGWYSLKSGLSHYLWELAGQIEDIGVGEVI